MSITEEKLKMWRKSCMMSDLASSSVCLELISEVEKLKQLTDEEIPLLMKDRTEATKNYNELLEENAKLKAKLWITKDSQLRTYDGMAQKADRTDELETRIKALEDQYFKDCKTWMDKNFKLEKDVNRLEAYVIELKEYDDIDKKAFLNCSLENNILTEALTFYADKQTYEVDPSFKEWDFTPILDLDSGGNKARQAFAKIKDLK